MARFSAIAERLVAHWLIGRVFKLIGVRFAGARRVAPHCELPPHHHQQQQQQQQFWHHLLRMYADTRRLPPEVLSALVQPALSPFSSAAMLVTSSSASLMPSDHHSGPTGNSINIATSVCNF